MENIDAKIHTLLEREREEAILFVKELTKGFLAALDAFTGDWDFFVIPVSTMRTPALYQLMRDLFDFEGFSASWFCGEGIITIKDAGREGPAWPQLARFRAIFAKRQQEEQAKIQQAQDREWTNQKAEALAKTIARFNRLVESGCYLTQLNFTLELEVDRKLLTSTSDAKEWECETSRTKYTFHIASEELKYHITAAGFSGANGEVRLSSESDVGWVIDLQPANASQMLTAFSAAVRAEAAGEHANSIEKLREHMVAT